MPTPEELLALAKKEAEDKVKTEAQKKVDAIAVEKGRPITEDGTDLTAGINLNKDPSTLKWEDSIKRKTWNLFIIYLGIRKRTKKDLKGNIQPDDEFSAIINEGTTDAKTQEFLDDFNNNYIFTKAIVVTEQTQKYNPGSKTYEPIVVNEKYKVLEKFNWTDRYGKLTTADVREAQKYHSITNPIGYINPLNEKKTEVKQDGRIGTQTIQMVYPYRVIKIAYPINNEYRNKILEVYAAKAANAQWGINRTTIGNVNFNNYSKTYFPNSQVPEYGYLTSNGSRESLVPIENDPNIFHKVVYGNKRYVIASDYVHKIMKDAEDSNPDEFTFNYGTWLSVFFPDKSKWIPYNPSYANKLSKYEGYNWGTPEGPNWDIIKPTQVLPSQQQLNSEINKNKIKALKDKAETIIKDKLTKPK
jgi:hypothetical protein